MLQVGNETGLANRRDETRVQARCCPAKKVFLMSFLQNRAYRARAVLSVCFGALLLAGNLPAQAASLDPEKQNPHRQLAQAQQAGPGEQVNITDKAREKPLSELELMDFLDRIAHAQVLDRECPELFSDVEKNALYLAYRWARSVASSDAYRPQILLVNIQAKSAYARELKGLDCGAKETREVADSFNHFLAEAQEKVRFSEIQ